MPDLRTLIRRDPRYLVAGFLTLILILGHLLLGFLESVGQLLTSLVAALVTEVVLSRIYRGVWPNPVSAYMTGVSIGILVRSPAWWPYALGSVLGIGQKYVIQVGGRHLFNPSNFGLCLLLAGAPDMVAALGKQWTNLPAVTVFVFALGFLVIARLGRLDLVGTYVAGFVVMTFLRSALTGVPVLAELGEAFGPPFQLFTFFMITDPRTSPAGRAGRIGYAVTIALVETGFRLARVVHAPFYSLFLVSPLAIGLETLRESGAARPAPERAGPAAPGA